MALFRFSGRDMAAFKVLFFLAIMYGLMSILVYFVLHMKFTEPLGLDAAFDRFSEERAIEHLRVLSKEIDGRQVGRQGLKQAADYIRKQLELIRGRANPNFRIEVEETLVNGSFNMMFLGHSISLTYREHTNVLMRISSIDSLDTDASVLVNAHFDSPLGSPGAGDCGSCVASLLELARLVVDSGWVPPRPIIFLFNGAEELFMLGSHGFITTHKWRDTVGAFINVEASGSGGPDVVCQSGPGSWASLVYAKAAPRPMAHSAAQDVFSVIPGDTDYRIFAQDYGDIPGLDIIFLLGGYFYHTSFDTVERLLPGSMQARGDNLFSVVKAFASSSMLHNASERQSLASSTKRLGDDRAIYFDYLSWFMVYYPKRIAAILHTLPIIIFFLPVFVSLAKFGLYACCRTFFDFIKGMLIHAIAIILAIIVPVIFAILRLLFSSHAMNWFAHPYLGFMMFIPCAVVGLLIPRYVWRSSYFSQDTSVQQILKEGVTDESSFWGAFAYYAVLTLAYHLAGLSGGFMTLFVSVSLLVAWTFSHLIGFSNSRSLRSLVGHILLLLPCLTYSVHFGGFLAQFLIEKMGMMGSAPPPYGYYVQDIVVAAMIGVVTGWCVGPLLPFISHWLARSSVMRFLLHLSVLSLALSSQFFPYSPDAPKRVVLQHTVFSADSTQPVDSNYDFTVVDSNPLPFLFKHAPEAAQHLQIGSEFSFESAKEKWLAVFPVAFLFSRSLKFPAGHDDILRQYKSFPYMSTLKREESSDTGTRKVHVEFSLGSLKEVWVAVLNITGPLSSWSFADNILPAPETVDGGPPSYICRLSGATHRNWTFWLEAYSSEPLRVEVAVLDQHLLDETKKLKDSFPEWVDVTAYTSFMSSYLF